MMRRIMRRNSSQGQNVATRGTIEQEQWEESEGQRAGLTRLWFTGRLLYMQRVWWVWHTVQIAVCTVECAVHI